MKSSCIACLIVALVTVGLVVRGAVADERKGDVACSTAAIDPDVWMVKSGGLWKLNGEYGNYRVLVVRRGVEHAMDHIEVQVTTVNHKRGIRHCSVVESPGLKGYVTDIRIHPIGTTRAAIEVDVDMKAMDGVILKEVFLASADGQVTPLVEAKYVDLSVQEPRRSPTAEGSK